MYKIIYCNSIVSLSIYLFIISSPLITSYEQSLVYKPSRIISRSIYINMNFVFYRLHRFVSNLHVTITLVLCSLPKMTVSFVSARKIDQNVRAVHVSLNCVNVNSLRTTRELRDDLASSFAPITRSFGAIMKISRVRTRVLIGTRSIPKRC